MLAKRVGIGSRSVQIPDRRYSGQANRVSAICRDAARGGTASLPTKDRTNGARHRCERIKVRKRLSLNELLAIPRPPLTDRAPARQGSAYPQKHVWRARIVLLSAEGVGTMAIQRQTGKGKPTIWRWQARFMAKGVDGLLHEATRPAGKPPLSAEVIERVVEVTLAEPLGEATHWTCRAMAKAAGVSHRSVQRIWAAHGLKPHRVRTFKLSNDPKFAAKVQDVIGL